LCKVISGQDTIHEEEDVVKAISYINCHWKSHEMWKENPTFKSIDARMQTSEMISKKWKEEIADDKYLHANDDFYGLGVKK